MLHKLRWTHSEGEEEEEVAAKSAEGSETGTISANTLRYPT